MCFSSVFENLNSLFCFVFWLLCARIQNKEVLYINWYILNIIKGEGLLENITEYKYKIKRAVAISCYMLFSVRFNYRVGLCREEDVKQCEI